jgi:hypothetical protein
VHQFSESRRLGIAAGWTLLFTLALTAVDLVVRRSVVAAWAGYEWRQFGLSLLGSLSFWFSLGALSAGGKRRGLLLMLTLATGGLALFIPWAHFFVYRRFSNEEAFLFLANNFTFVWNTLVGNLWPALALFFMCIAAAGAHAFGARRVIWPTSAPWVAVLVLAVNLAILAVTTFSISLPLTADQVSLRLLTRVVTGVVHPRHFSNCINAPMSTSRRCLRPGSTSCGWCTRLLAPAI